MLKDSSFQPDVAVLCNCDTAPRLEFVLLLVTSHKVTKCVPLDMTVPLPFFNRIPNNVDRPYYTRSLE
jgi:hypothetical protein